MNPDDWLEARERDSLSASEWELFCQSPPATQDALTTRFEGEVDMVEGLLLNFAGLSKDVVVVGGRKPPKLTGLGEFPYDLIEKAGLWRLEGLLRTSASSSSSRLSVDTSQSSSLNAKAESEVWLALLAMLTLSAGTKLLSQTL